jgi:hypothetical protein
MIFYYFPITKNPIKQISRWEQKYSSSIIDPHAAKEIAVQEYRLK